MAKQKWTAADIEDQSGQTFVVTGANSGLGLASTRALTAAGATVVMACRNLDKADEARTELPTADRERAEILELDLADLRTVDAFAAQLKGRDIDVLINNAGLMNIPEGRTAQGLEQQFGVNVVGHFALLQALGPQIKDRTVWLGSLMHLLGRIALDDLLFERRRYSAWPAYGQSKLACVMLAYEQQRRYIREGSTLRAMVAHPGYSATNLQSRSENLLVDAIMAAGNSLPFLAQSAEAGALPELYAATVPDLAGGSYIGPDGLGEASGHPRIVTSKAASYDPDVSAALWARCEELAARR